MGGTVNWEKAPLPDVEQPELAPYWEGTRQGELRIPSCAGCGKSLWPPRAACSRCGALEKHWKPVPAQGTLFTWTVVGHPTVAGFEDLVPYAVGVVEIDGEPGVRMTGRLLTPHVTLQVGARVRAVFEQVNDRLTIPVWEVEES
jgi:uncharacterized OB-fold protein